MSIEDAVAAATEQGWRSACVEILEVLKFGFRAKKEDRHDVD